jgi:hypothetical protein
MASNPSTPQNDLDEKPLSHEQWWALFDELRISQQADYAAYGGPIAFFRKERDADAELPDARRP